MRRINIGLKFPTDRRFLFVSIIYLLCLFSIGCSKRRINNADHRELQTPESISSTNFSFTDGGCFQLPLAGRFRLVKATTQQDVESGPALNATLLDSESLLRQHNKIGELSPNGQFILNSEKTVVGYSFRIFDHENSYAHDCLDEPVRFHDYYPMRTSFCPDCNSKFKDIEIHSLEGLNHIFSIEFVDFSSCGFSPGIWEDLRSMSESGSLRGISLWNGEGFLDVRGGIIAPRISGLAVNIEAASRLREFGDAFPSLSFLAVTVPDRKSINTLFGLIKQSFPNLKGLMIGNSRWPGSEFDQLPKGRESHAKLRVSLKQIPPGMEWICVDGGLMALDDMEKFDEFGVKLRYKEGYSSLKLIIDRHVEVVFMGFGYSAGGARSMHVGEYKTLEKYWRSKP